MNKEVSHKAKPNLNIIFKNNNLCELWDNLLKQMFLI